MKSGSIALPYTPRVPICAHQVHAHRVAAEREERGVAEAEDAGEAPHQVDRQGEDGEAQVLADSDTT